MNRDAFLAQWGYFDMVHGVTMRAIGVLADEDLDFRPKDTMRTVKALLFHIYAAEKQLAEAIPLGELTEAAGRELEPESEPGSAALAEIRSVEDMKSFAERCHNAAKAALDGISDAELSRIVRSEYGDFTGAQYFTFLYDEHWHHRGQFYTYLRLLDKEPPSIYGYGSERD